MSPREPAAPAPSRAPHAVPAHGLGEPAPDLIAAAVLACPVVADLHGGRFGEVATYFPGRRVTGVQVTPTEVRVHLVGRYPVPVADIDHAVRAALAPHLAGLPLTITVEDYAPVTSHPPTVPAPDVAAPADTKE